MGGNMWKYRKQQTYKKKMTERQQQIYNYIVEYITENGYPPSYREIADANKISSTSTVFDVIEKLELRGLIKTRENAPRAIKVIGYKFVKEEL